MNYLIQEFEFVSKSIEKKKDIKTVLRELGLVDSQISMAEKLQDRESIEITIKNRVVRIKALK